MGGARRYGEHSSCWKKKPNAPHVRMTIFPYGFPLMSIFSQFHLSLLCTALLENLGQAL